MRINDSPWLPRYHHDLYGLKVDVYRYSLVCIYTP